MHVCVRLVNCVWPRVRVFVFCVLCYSCVSLLCDRLILLCVCVCVRAYLFVCVSVCVFVWLIGCVCALACFSV